MSDRFALIHNPRSRRNLKVDAQYMDMLAAMPDHVLHIPQTHDDLQRTLDALARDPVACLVVDGGDGTVCSVLSALNASAWPRDSWPLIVVLPSGNTNLIASDVGFASRGVKALDLVQDRLRAWRAGTAKVSVRRPLLVSCQQDKGRDLLGFFGGFGAFTHGVGIAHQPTILSHCSHDAAVLVTLLVAFAQMLSPTRRQSWLEGVEALISADGVTSLGRSHFMLLCTALHSLPHGVWPFWSKNGVVHKGVSYLDVAAMPERLFAACWHLLRGRVPEWLRRSSAYKSGNAEILTVCTNQPFVLDGEIIQPAENDCLTVKAGPEVSFLRA